MKFSSETASSFKTMILPFLILVAGAAVWAQPEIKDCVYCRENMARCVPGRELRGGSGCVRCVCNADSVYRCKGSAECNINQELKNSSSSISRCEPRMIYVRGSLTCMCSQAGYWPHRKCDIAFPTLREYKPDEPHPEEVKIVNTGNSCEPFSMVRKGCKLCRCSASGVVVEEQCTRSECPRAAPPPPAADRRAAPASARRQGSRSCQPGVWYAISACQLCYCRLHNRLSCSTKLAAAASQTLLSGAHSLTQCDGLVRELYRLSPESFDNRSITLAESPPVIPPAGPGSEPTGWEQNYWNRDSTTPTTVNSTVKLDNEDEYYYYTDDDADS